MGQHRHVALKRRADLAKDCERQIADTALDTAHIRPINIGAGGEFFLGQPEQLAPLSYALPKALKNVLIHDYKARRNGDYESTDDDTLLGDGRAGRRSGFPMPSDCRRADRLTDAAALPVDHTLERGVADAVFLGVVRVDSLGQVEPGL